jgi:hypothetical protein
VAQELPEGFQTAEFLLRKGFVDRITPRAELAGTVRQILGIVGDGLEALASPRFESHRRGLDDTSRPVTPQPPGGNGSDHIEIHKRDGTGDIPT